MKHKLHLSVLFVFCISLFFFSRAEAQSPLGTGFTYQGYLAIDGVPVNGNCDFQFRLWDDFNGGMQIGSTVPKNNVLITDGVFTVTLDFGSGAFNGEARWLGVAVRCPAGSGSYTTLTPYQELSAAPYALYSQSAPWGGLSGVPFVIGDLSGTYPYLTVTALQGKAVSSTAPSDGQVLKWSGSAWTPSAFDADTLDGQHASGFADAGHNHDLAYWKLGGNAGTVPGTDYIGTSDNQALEIKVNGQRVMRLEPNAISPNIINGYNGNWITNGVIGATIAGGGTSSFSNRVTDYYGTISGGYDNQAGDNAVPVDDKNYATVGGGQRNTASGAYSTISGGSGNVASGNGSTISGGAGNTSSGADASIGGGYQNLAQGGIAIVGGGYSNEVSGYSSVIGGGYNNLASGDYALVNGGFQNTASGFGSMIAGGFRNLAVGNYSFAAGYQARANHNGSFVWADSLNDTFNSTSDNQFAVRATGGVIIDVGNGNGFRLLPGYVPSLINGYSGNWITSGVIGAVIGGGGREGAVNRVSNDFGVVSGGINNEASTVATVCGGMSNTANGINSTVGGGQNNEAGGSYSFVGGGFSNHATSSSAVVNGGEWNIASADRAVIGGGLNNGASGPSSVVSGGSNNNATSSYSSISGGQFNITSGISSSIIGGYGNRANGDYSLAGGRKANADHQGSFVWADSIDADFYSTGINQFNVRAYGGVRFVTGGAGGTIDGYQIWHSGNDGSGSGLDADTLNGKFASEFAAFDHSHPTWYWSMAGNTGTTPGMNYIGTNDYKAFLIKVNGSQVVRYIPATYSPNIISGYYLNTIANGVEGSVIAGGGSPDLVNLITDSYGVIGGGTYNVAGDEDGNPADDVNITISGGYHNRALASYATISGGKGNTVSGDFSVVTGGGDNVSSGSYSIVAGGYNNAAVGDYSFAAGNSANAMEDGVFTWSDVSGTSFSGSIPNSFNARSSGGVYFYTKSDLSSGVSLAAGGNAWSSISDWNMKDNFQAISGEKLLENLAAIPISTWNYKSQDESIRHIGPMAQDFYRAFNVGEDNLHISTIDADGVALAGVQALYAENQALKARIEKLEAGKGGGTANQESHLWNILTVAACTMISVVVSKRKK